jgi:hypothetical protein
MPPHTLAGWQADWLPPVAFAAALPPRMLTAPLAAQLFPHCALAMPPVLQAAPQASGGGGGTLALVLLLTNPTDEDVVVELAEVPEAQAKALGATCALCLPADAAPVAVAAWEDPNLLLDPPPSARAMVTVRLTD